MSALREWQDEADAQRARAEATEECARLRAAGDAAAFREGILRRDRDALAMERDHYRERAQTLRARVDWMQSVAAEAMRVGLATCRDLRGRLRGEGLRLARATAAVEGMRAIVEGRTAAPRRGGGARGDLRGGARGVRGAVG